LPYIPDSKRGGRFGETRAEAEEPFHEYWYHLGRFINSFSQAEAQILLLLRKISRISPAAAGVVFHGLRLEQAKDQINNLLSVRGNEKRKMRLARPFDHLMAIGTIRNNIVHWGATLEREGGFKVSNKKYSPLKPKESMINIDDLDALYKDLSVIHILLWLETNDVRSGDPMYRSVAQVPWLYIPPQPTPPASKKDRSPTKRRTPPPSSP
jgi:hypothetical protein